MFVGCIARVAYSLAEVVARIDRSSVRPSVRERQALTINFVSHRMSVGVRVAKISITISFLIIIISDNDHR